MQRKTGADLREIYQEFRNFDPRENFNSRKVRKRKQRNQDQA